MEQARWQQIGTIVDAVLALESPEEQTALIKERCGNDEALKNEVIGWLDSITKSQGLWDELLLSNRVLMQDMTMPGISSAEAPAEPLPESIGLYKIKRRLGRGGMADVYLAERMEGDFHQQVALKVIRKEVVSAGQKYRFLQERTLLSRLNHPHIARLLDGGVCRDGRPYYVMEYVHGVPLTEHCTQHNCTLNERLVLFGQICQAVQYAHANFIVHRDLKPDNLLVTSDSTVKVLDFGIAKLLDQELSEQALLQTQAGQRLLSLHYAAPEQITMEPVTATTDVYALGLLLYELLSGVRPFDLKGKNLVEAEQIIRTHAPPLPSVASVKQNASLKGDLNAIILKALRKEPEQRYESASRLWEDIECYRSGRPVQARKGTFRYKVGKFIHRNRTALIAAAFFLIAAVGFGSYHMYQLNQERDAARLEAEKAEQVTQYLVALFKSADPNENVHDTLTVYDLLRRGKEKVKDLNGKPNLQVDLLLALGNAYQNTGAYDDAQTLLLKADSVTRQHYPSDSYETANTALFLGSLYNEQRGFAPAKQYYRRAAEFFKKSSNKHWEKAAYTYTGFGLTMTELGKPDSGVVLIRKGLEILEANTAGRAQVVLAKTKLAMAFRGQRKYREAETIYREILNETDLQESHDNDNIRIVTLNNLAYVLRLQEQYREAEHLYRRALSLHEKIYGEDHPTSTMMLGNLATVVFAQKRNTETEKLLLRQINLHKKRYPANHWRIGAAHDRLANFYFQTDQFKKSATHYSKSRKIYTAGLGGRHIWTGLAHLQYYLSSVRAYPQQNFEPLFEQGMEVLKENPLKNYSHYDRNLLKTLIVKAESSGMKTEQHIQRLRKLLADI